MITPIFTYGTLRPQAALASAWAPYALATCDGYCTLPGGRLMLPLHGQFPYLTFVSVEEVLAEEVTPAAVGALLVPHDEDAELLLLDTLDQMEGHPTHYERKMFLVHVIAGPLTEVAQGYAFNAWAYQASDTTIAQHQWDWQPVLNNDWYQHCNALRGNHA